MKDYKSIEEFENEFTGIIKSMDAFPTRNTSVVFLTSLFEKGEAFKSMDAFLTKNTSISISEHNGHLRYEVKERQGKKYCYTPITREYAMKLLSEKGIIGYCFYPF